VIGFSTIHTQVVDLKAKLDEAQETNVQLKANPIPMIELLQRRLQAVPGSPTASLPPTALSSAPLLQAPNDLARSLPSVAHHSASYVQEDQQDLEGIKMRIELLVKDVTTTQLALQRLHDKVF
jgi:hypothetical protein